VSERRRIEGLTGTQVAANVLATMTAAIVASYLGIAGTIIGAAVASAATTAGTAVYRHYLGRTQQRLRTATSAIAPKVAAHTHLGHVPAQLDPVRAEASRVPDRAGAANAAAQTQPDSPAGIDPVRAAAGLGETREIGRFEPGGTISAPPGQPAQAAPPGPPGEPGNPGEPGTTAATPGPPTEPGEEDHAAPHGWAGRQRWLVLAGAAVGVFIITMAIITLVENAAGKPLDAVVWQRHGSGTTVSDTVTGGSSRPHRSHSPSPARTSPATPGPSSASPGPARTSTSPTPVPSASPSASPSPSGTTSAPQSPVPAASSPAP
jgi:hypothetical protein